MAPNQGPVREKVKTVSEHRSSGEEGGQQEIWEGGWAGKQLPENGLDGGQDLHLFPPKLLCAHLYTLYTLLAIGGHWQHGTSS